MGHFMQKFNAKIFAQNDVALCFAPNTSADYN